MSLFLSNIILHQIQKNESGELKVHCRSELLNNTPVTEQLIVELHREFSGKVGKGLGYFTADSQFQAELRAMHSNHSPFFDFSLRSAERLAAELNKLSLIHI